MNEWNWLLTWQGFYGLIGGMQGVDGGSLVLEGYPGRIWAPVTVNQHLVTVLGLDEGPSLWVDVEVDQFLKAPLVGFTVETGHQTHLGGVLLVQEIRALDEAALRDRTAKAKEVEEEDERLKGKSLTAQHHFVTEREKWEGKIHNNKGYSRCYFIYFDKAKTSNSKQTFKKLKKKKTLYIKK